MDGTRARALLGVSAHATPDELRRAFRRRALSTHPDRGGDAAGFDETVVAFRSLATVPCTATAAPHVPFDRYDSAARRTTVADRRDTFAEILQRVTATPVAA
jgi:hypothetical protein